MMTLIEFIYDRNYPVRISADGGSTHFAHGLVEEIFEAYAQYKAENLSISGVSVFSEKRMWDIDGKLVVGSPVTDDEVEYYNRFFDEMVSEMQDDSDHWTHHASKVSN